LARLLAAWLIVSWVDRYWVLVSALDFASREGTITLSVAARRKSHSCNELGQSAGPVKVLAPMIFEHIETLKKKFTDKYVVVDGAPPELKRFAGLTGTVKTVNMSGRALVEFDGYNNIGWYDIDPTFLKVVDAPLPKPEEPAKKGKEPAAKAEKSAPAKPTTVKAPAAGGGKSVADIIAAAKAGKGAAAAPTAKAESAAPPAAAAPAGGKGMSVADILAAARSKPGAAPAGAAATPAPAAKASPAPPAALAAKVDPKKMSVADIIAAAKANKPAGGAPTASAPTASAPAAAPPAEVEAESEFEESVVVEPASTVEGDHVANSPAASGGKRSKQHEIKGVAAQVAYCRQVDGK
jgi:hypothetical protein